MITDLYRHYDENGCLLYVGISLDAAYRLKGHKREAGWFGHIAHITVEHYPSRVLAEAAEQIAIRAENPLWNKRHKAVPSPLRLSSGKSLLTAHEVADRHRARSIG